MESIWLLNATNSYRYSNVHNRWIDIYYLLFIYFYREIAQHLSFSCLTTNFIDLLSLSIYLISPYPLFSLESDILITNVYFWQNIFISRQKYLRGWTRCPHCSGIWHGLSRGEKLETDQLLVPTQPVLFWRAISGPGADRRHAVTAVNSFAGTRRVRAAAAGAMSMKQIVTNGTQVNSYWLFISLLFIETWVCYVFDILSSKFYLKYSHNNNCIDQSPPYVIKWLSICKLK